MNKKEKKPRKPITNVKAIAAYVLCIAIIGGLSYGNWYAMRYQKLISVNFDQATTKIVEGDGNQDSNYFKSDYDSEEEQIAAAEQTALEIEREGIVLLKNDDNVLPLASGTKISVFGQDAVDPIYGGAGAGSIDVSKAVTLKQSIEDAGFEINKTLWDFYESGEASSYRKEVPSVTGEGRFAVNEVPVSVYTDAVKESFQDYSDAAVVVIGRSGSESGDISQENLGVGATYLQLDTNEKDMLQMVCDSFDKVIVLLNTMNPMELAEIDEYGVDSCVWIGAFGETGAPAVGEVLNGTVNPSGALVDTYAYDSFSAPSIENLGSYAFTNSKEMFGTNYMVYGEGIYVGYLYYETRYEDVVLGNESADNYNYVTQVQYPFGHGLSYTDFKWSDYSVSETDNTFDISVNVTNTGDTAGKDVIQIYMQSPYTDYDKANQIEKAAVELVGFEKTSLLEAGESEKVTVSVNKEEMKTYDEYGKETYILDAGDYYFAAGVNAHDALNNILAAKGYSVEDGMDADGNSELAYKETVSAQDNTKYAVSVVTGNEITNEFSDVNLKSQDSDYTYLSRSDWTGTWPVTYKDGQWEASDEILEALKIRYEEDPEVETPVTGTVDSEVGELSVAMLREAEYDDEAWSTLIQQMSVSELDKLVRIGGYATGEVKSIQLPATVDKDGTSGISNTLVGGANGVGFPTEIVLASTWNKDLAEAQGIAVGEDSLRVGVQVWYAPACNIHRSPYSGRSFEYYSEDSYISGQMAAAVTKGAMSKGVITTVKHFALNDQETNRMGVSIYSNEQAARELYLKPFEIAVRDGKASAIMASMNRIGNTWTGGHKGLMTAALREEWGFEGFVVTDQASYDVFSYEDLREGLAAGTDLWLNTDETLWKIPDGEMNDTIISQMQTAAKHIAYAVSKSNAINGITSDSKIVSIIPLWQKALFALDAVVSILVLFTLFVVTRGLVRRKKDSR